MTGCIDNTRGKKNVQGRLVLERIRFKASSGGTIDKSIEESHSYVSFINSALPGISTNFKFNA